jgi:hypothetical protein
MRIDVEETGARQAARRQTKISEHALDLRPALSDIVDKALIPAERRQFATGAGWRPLAASTRARKRRQGLPSRVMRAAGKLERVLTVRGAAGQLVDIDRTSVTFGIKGGRSDAYYGRFHQKGKGVPKRVVVPKPTRRTERDIAHVVRRHLMS